jgi:hypothetical protein
MSLVKIGDYQLLSDFFPKSAQGCLEILRHRPLFFQRVDFLEIWRASSLVHVDVHHKNPDK